MAFTYTVSFPMSDKDWVRRRLDATSDEDVVIARVATDEEILVALQETDRVEAAARMATRLSLAYAKEIDSFGEAGGVRFSYKNRASSYRELAETIRAEGEGWEAQSLSGGLIGEIERGVKDVPDFLDMAFFPEYGMGYRR